MTATRRQVLAAGGGIAAALCLPRLAARAADVIEIAMDGRRDGSRVWFDPIGLHVRPGQVVRWVNRDLGNSHTATAYHPGNGGRPRRIPDAAEPWDSGYLLPEESFSFTFVEEGVYDYYCVPHEMAGMVGRIVVGASGTSDWSADADAEIPETALKAFPTVEHILRTGIVRAA